VRFSRPSPTTTRHGDATRRNFDSGSRTAEDPDPREEFREFAAASQGHLRRSAYLLCGDWHFAEDLVQTAFDRIYRHWNRVRAADNPGAYARQVVYRCFLDSRKKRLDVVPLEHLPEKASPSVEPTETRLAVLEALKQLPPRARAVVVLRYWEDMSVEQTAAVLDISQGAVKSMASRGLGLLREPLAGFSGTSGRS
jgi:RNA polymerase sigma-70 factor (sigma-E family)